MKKPIISLLLTVLLAIAAVGFSGRPSFAAESAWPSPDPALLESAYAGGEKLTYDVSWLGILAGRLEMEIIRAAPDSDNFTIMVIARPSDFFAVFHPVVDHFETLVSGAGRLPSRYSSRQEGRKPKSKLTLYDQERLSVMVMREGKEPERYELPYPVHNEFSSFLILRAFPLTAASEPIIPTFADNKAHPVKVAVEGREELETIFGRRMTIRVRPRLTFKGLYDKQGDATIWLTDDVQRLPVQIKAKIKIGSLTATLIHYTRPGYPFSPPSPNGSK